MSESQLQHNLIESYLDWWTVSGAEYAFDAHPVNQLAGAPQIVVAQKPPRLDTQAPVTARSHAFDKKIVIAQKPAPIALPIPDTLPGMQDWLASNALVPGAKWSGRALPSGNANPRIMVIGDQPDTQDISAGQIFSGAPGDLLDAMLAAIDILPDKVYKASFCVTRPLPRAMTDRDKSDLALVVRHHVSLVNPDYVLILGRSTGIALLGQDVTISPQSLRDFNHISGNVPCIGTFHPRALMNQPALKKQAWTTLKVLQTAMQATG